MEDLKNKLKEDQNKFSSAYEKVIKDLKSDKYDGWVFKKIIYKDTNTVVGSYFISNDIIQRIANNPDLLINIEFNKNGKATSFSGREKEVELYNLIMKNICKAVHNMPYWLLMRKCHPIWINENISLPQKYEEMGKVYRQFVYGEDITKETKNLGNATKPEIKESVEVEAEKKKDDTKKAKTSLSANPGYERLNKIYDELLKAVKPLTKEIDRNIDDKYELPERFESTLKRKFKNINEILHGDNIGELKKIKQEGEQIKVYEKISDLRTSAEKKQPNEIARQLLADKLGVSTRIIDYWLAENNIKH